MDTAPTMLGVPKADVTNRYATPAILGVLKKKQVTDG